MDISIIICTYNRAALLADTLNSLSKLDFPAAVATEIMVVDNNSTDKTPEIVNQTTTRLPSIRYVFEASPGLSHARNRGINEARGNIIAFIDDDVFLDKNWLTQLLASFRDKSISCFGGQSIPVFESGEPEWLCSKILQIYGSTNSGEIEKVMNYPEHPFGLNMAFRREVFELVGNFNLQLGRKKTSLLSNEEADIFYRIHHANLKTLYNPNAIIYHRIPHERTDKNWVLKRYYWQGISAVAFKQITSPIGRLALLIKCFSLMGDIKNNLIGGLWLSPKKLYWHLNSIPFKQTIIIYTDAGRLRQTFFELFH